MVSSIHNFLFYLYRLSNLHYLYVPFSIDATAETGRYGRLLNHSRVSPNCVTKVIMLGDTPRLILVAKHHIDIGEELLYDYGDRSKESLKAHPWLAL